MSSGSYLSSALEKRERQIEADLREEELRYRRQLTDLHRDLDNMKTTESKFRTEVN